MKRFLATTAAVLTLSATTAMAGDFDNTVFGVDVTSGALDFSLDANEKGLTDFAVGATGFAHKSFGGFDASVRGELNYNFDADTIGIRAEYNVIRDVAANVAVYGSAAVEYVTANTDLGDGDFYLDPSIGVLYEINPKVSVFGELGYTWDMSNDFRAVGGYVELGLPVQVTETVAVVPSLVRTIDTGADETNLSLRVAVSF